MKHSCWTIGLALAAAWCAGGQTLIDLRRQARDVDFSGAASTRPARTGTTLPSSCKTGELFFKTDETPGSNLYGCTATGVWNKLGNGGSTFPDPMGQQSKGLFSNGAGTAWGEAVRTVTPGAGLVTVCSNGAGASSGDCWVYVDDWYAATQPGSNVYTGNNDFSGAASMRFRSGSDLPATCFVAEAFFKTSAPADQNGYGCTSPNTWTPLGGGGSIWNVFGRMGNITAQTGDYTAAQVTNAVDASGTYSNPAWLTALGYTAAATGLCPAGFVTATTASGVTCSVPAATSYALKFDGSSTSLADGSTVTWSCGSGAGAQCTTTYTVPAGMNWVTVQAWSGGAGGDGSSQGSATDGGGGGYFTGKCAVTPGGTVSVAVGLGGPHGYHQGTTTSGGGTSFGTCFTLLGARHAWTGDAVGGYLSGGLPGTSGWQSTYGALTGNCTPSGTVGYSALRPDGGGCGGGATVSSGAVGAAGGYANYGGGGGGAGGFNSNTGGVGGTSGIGGAGGNGGGWTSGTGVIACTAGSISGGGGGGAGVETAGGSNLNGCDGARGEVRVYYTR